MTHCIECWEVIEPTHDNLYKGRFYCKNCYEKVKEKDDKASGVGCVGDKK